MIGTTILGYEIDTKLGEGGMGAVYRAVNPLLGQVVAIKLLDPTLARNADIRERFVQEARIQITLQHPGIVRVLTADVSGERPALVMEYVDGLSLAEVLGRRGALPTAEALRLFEQICAAVGHAHAHGVVHRDLKPANVMVQGNGVVKVMDFGIARVMGSSALTRTGTSMGSPQYMSPEQVLGRKDLDHRTDIYSLGCIAYELFTGHRPFAAIEDDATSDSDYRIKDAHVRAEPADPRRTRPDLPPAVAAAILKALAKAPDRRFQQASELAAALQTGALSMKSDLHSGSPQPGAAPPAPAFTLPSDLDRSGVPTPASGAPEQTAPRERARSRQPAGPDRRPMMWFLAALVGVGGALACVLGFHQLTQRNVQRSVDELMAERQELQARLEKSRARGGGLNDLVGKVENKKCPPFSRQLQVALKGGSLQDIIAAFGAPDWRSTLTWSYSGLIRHAEVKSVENVIHTTFYIAQDPPEAVETVKARLIQKLGPQTDPGDNDYDFGRWALAGASVSIWGNPEDGDHAVEVTSSKRALAAKTPSVGAPETQLPGPDVSGENENLKSALSTSESFNRELERTAGVVREKRPVNLGDQVTAALTAGSVDDMVDAFGLPDLRTDFTWTCQGSSFAPEVVVQFRDGVYSRTVFRGRDNPDYFDSMKAKLTGALSRLPKEVDGANYEWIVNTSTVTLYYYSGLPYVIVD